MGKATGVVKMLKGSFNFCLQVSFEDDGPDAIIRFPKPEHATFLEEKISNEVQVVKFL